MKPASAVVLREKLLSQDVTYKGNEILPLLNLIKELGEDAAASQVEAEVDSGEPDTIDQA